MKLLNLISYTFLGLTVLATVFGVCYAAAGLRRSTEALRTASCEMFAEWPHAEIPARCVAHFQAR